MTPTTEHAAARILVVDDEPANLTLLRHMLNRAGYRHITTVADSRTVMAHVRSHQPDLILLDLHMPPPDGFMLLDQLDEVVPESDIVPILVLSADVTTDAREVALGHGAHDFLTKPFHYPELLLRVHNLLTVRFVHTRLQRNHAEATSAMRTHQESVAAFEDRRRAITERIDRVVGGSGLRVVFQPVVDLVDGSIVGAEALARFTDPGAPGPEVMFLEADEVGRRVELEIFAIDRALEQLDDLPAGTFLSVNAGAATIRSGELADHLSAFPGWRIVIELTEHESIDDYPGLIAGFEALRQRGVRLAVDDTGSGFSSFGHILRLSPDIIKLDRALLTGVDTDPARRALMVAMVHFADETATMLIGEGIETDDELAVLRTLGLQHGQGYLLARPGALPLATSDLPGLRAPVAPTLCTPHRRGHSLSDVLHDGIVQELSAASLRLQLIAERLTDGAMQADVAVEIDGIRRAVAELGRIGLQFDQA